MSRSYRFVSYLEVDGKLPLEDCGFWQDILYRCLDEPQDVLEAVEDQFSEPDNVDVGFVWDNRTQFYLDIERNLCGGQSEDEFADEFRRAIHTLTKDVTLDFKVSLHMYFLEHDPDLAVEYNRQELAA
jgi:hypothetical protein